MKKGRTKSKEKIGRSDRYPAIKASVTASGNIRPKRTEAGALVTRDKDAMITARVMATAEGKEPVRRVPSENSALLAKRSPRSRALLLSASSTGSVTGCRGSDRVDQLVGIDFGALIGAHYQDACWSHAVMPIGVDYRDGAEERGSR
jgi:hypothetical protein